MAYNRNRESADALNLKKFLVPLISLLLMGNIVYYAGKGPLGGALKGLAAALRHSLSN